MANREHLAKLNQGVEAWNKWRGEYRSRSVKPDLSAADLSAADLSAADLRQANLSDADLTGANLRDANLTGANLRDADLTYARLSFANLSNVYLSQANLTDANLTGANLAGAYLTGAYLTGTCLGYTNLRDVVFQSVDITGATLFETVFANTDLRNAKGLETCFHDGPSTVDHRTLAKSWPLPPNFLRGCGLSEMFITSITSLLEAKIEMESVFISFSMKDQEFADRLYADLQNKGVRCWFAPHDIQGGKKIHEQIDEAIKVYDRLLLILSEHSMASPWVSTEIGKARKRERALEVERLEAAKRGEAKEKRRVLFPVGLVGYEAMRAWECFDGDLGTDSAKEIREFFIPDFSGWKTDHDGYKREFERLVRDLKAK